MTTPADPAPYPPADPTPDFAEHAWARPVEVRFEPPFVRVEWPDGVALDAYALWLYENTVAIDPVTRESVAEPGSLPPPDSLVAAQLDDRGALVLTWADGRRSVVHPGWLREVAAGEHVPSAVAGECRVWTTADHSEPPTHDGTTVLADDEVLAGWLADVVTYGLARLRGGGIGDRRFMRAVADRIGPIRGSNFGDVFTVEARQDADSTANTGLLLGQHTDLPTRETPPGFQFLHCVENTVGGGASRMTDGLAVVDELRRHHPDDFDALTTLQWVFANRARDGDHRWVGPVVDGLDGPGPLTLRAFYPVRLAPHMSVSEIPRAYRALRTFSRLAHDPRLMMTFRFLPGDLVGFDNRRVLHGRAAFDPGAGTRLLSGCYIDRDDVLSRLRVLRRDGVGVSIARRARHTGADAQGGVGTPRGDRCGHRVLRDA